MYEQISCHLFTDMQLVLKDNAVELFKRACKIFSVDIELVNMLILLMMLLVVKNRWVDFHCLFFDSCTSGTFLDEQLYFS